MFAPPLLSRAEALIAAYGARALRIVTAESCTGGLVAALLTEIAGSSAVVERGFVTYSNEAKQELLGVPVEIITRQGAVSAPCALAMATGALGASRADWAVSITGIAGPGGGTATKPVGLVHFGLARRGHAPVEVERRFAAGSRSAIRMAAVEQALALLESALVD